MLYFHTLLVFALIVLATAGALALLGTRVAARATTIVDSVARRPALAMAISAAVPFAGSALVAWLVMWPEPVVHDEFAYLLAADTFAQGRLTNPTHPLWEFFESFHIFHQPSYASKYPPAQSVLLAAGQVLGSPVIGVWLGGALMGAALCWMLYAWVRPRWAFLAGVIAAAQVGVAKYWTQTFWGGALAAAAGALVFGAVVRLARVPRPRDSLLLGIGMVVLANTRPFEGAVLAAVVLTYLVVAGRRRRTLGFAMLAPAAGVLVAGAILMASYNQAVVGAWWKLPYINYEEIYAVKPIWVFQRLRSPQAYRHHEICLFHKGRSCDDPRVSPNREIDGRHRGELRAENIEELRQFFLGRVLIVPFAIGLLSVALPLALLAALSLIALLLALSVSTYFQIHYAGPFTGAIYALSAIGLQRLESWRWRGRPLGCALATALLAGVAASVVLHAGRVRNIHTSLGHDDFICRRGEALQRLHAAPGPDLVIVRYGPQHDVHREWVYNAAAIDSAEIVWARDMGERNSELMEYFRGHRVWLLREGFSAEEDGLEPYPETSARAWRPRKPV